MTFRIGECSSCGATYKLPASFAADQARCKNCGGVVQIGKAGDVTPPKASAPPVPAKQPSGAAAAAQPPKAKREGPSMKERLLAERQAHAPSAAPHKPAAAKAAAPAKTAAVAKPAAKSAAAPAPAAAAAKTARPGRASAGARKRSGRGDADEDGGSSARGGRRRATEKKKPPIMGMIAMVVLIVGIGGGAFWYVNQEDADQDKVEAAGTSATTPATDTSDDATKTAKGDAAAEAPKVIDETSGKEDGAEASADTAATAEKTAAEKPVKKEAPPGDPASVDLSVIPKYGPIAGCSEARFAELEELAATMVDPEAGAASTRAQNELVKAGKEAFPAIFNALKAQDLTTDDGFRNADIAQRALTTLCNGNNFGWKYPSQEPDKFHYFDKKVIVSWSKSWEQAKDNDAAWAKLAKLDKVPDAPDKAEAEKKAAEATEDALDDIDD